MSVDSIIVFSDIDSLEVGGSPSVVAVIGESYFVAHFVHKRIRL